MTRQYFFPAVWLFATMLRLIVTIYLFLMFVGGVSDANAQMIIDCGSLQNAYGPYDYTNPEHYSKRLPIVEAGHFDFGVEQLKGHQSKPGGDVMLGGDIDYTLRAFPNHHRALYTMLRYYVDLVPRGANPLRYSADCYFERAIKMAPFDASSRLLQGIYFLKVYRPDDARTSFETALELAPNSAEIHYNAGLGYMDLEEYELALHHAERAYKLGYPLMGLKNKLKRVGVWPENQEAMN